MLLIILNDTINNIYLKIGVLQLNEIEFTIISRISGIFLGFVLSFFYVHYAWYTRSPSKNTKTNVKIKGLGIFSLTTGVPALIGINTENFEILTTYMLLSGFGCIIFLLLLMCSFAYICGLKSSSDPNNAVTVAIKCSMEAFFKGWPFVDEIIHNEKSNIHTESKRALLRLNRELNILFKELPESDRPLLEFKSHFKAILGVVLYQFFQHSYNDHPNFSASYYKLSNNKSEFELISRITGTGNYHINGQSKLGMNSIAMKSLIEGKPILFPDDTKLYRIKPNPPLRNKKINKFIILPIPFDSELEFKDRKGILCIDSSKKDPWQLNDCFHTDLLVWVTEFIDQLHDKYLKEI